MHTFNFIIKKKIINQLIMMWYDFEAVLDLLDWHSDL